MFGIINKILLYWWQRTLSMIFIGDDIMFVVNVEPKCVSINK